MRGTKHNAGLRGPVNVIGLLNATLGIQQGAVARTATADGSGDGTIADGTGAVAVTSASANNIIVLPTPTPGTVLYLAVGANGYELRSNAPATVAIGGGTGANAESAIPANSVAVLFCISATAWVGFTIAGATLAAVEAAA